MEFLLFDILLIPIGWLALRLNYRDSKERSEAFKIDYANSYSDAAKDLIGGIALIFFGFLIIAFVIIMIVVSI